MNRTLIEYRKIGLLPTCIGNERIRIDMDGKRYYARNSHECEEGEPWSAEWQQTGVLDVSAMEALLRDIKESGVLTLPVVMTDESVEGGKREELFLWIDAAEHHFVMQNYDSPVFRKVIQLLWGVLT